MRGEILQAQVSHRSEGVGKFSDIAEHIPRLAGLGIGLGLSGEAVESGPSAISQISGERG